MQYKPVTSLSGPFDPIPVHRLAQEGSGLDYECELVAVIGRRCADVPESKALDYVLGYAVGNDISHRDWQVKRGGGQWGLGKGFDAWAPFGPGIVSADVIKDPQALKITTRLNGKTVQASVRCPWSVDPDANAPPGKLHGRYDFQREEDHRIPEPGDNSLAGRRYFYRDVSLRGFSCLTGYGRSLTVSTSPEGVGMGKNPPVWLKDGDVVDVSLEGVGTCTNKVEFASPEKWRL